MTIEEKYINKVMKYEKPRLTKKYRTNMRIPSSVASLGNTISLCLQTAVNRIFTVRRK